MLHRTLGVALVVGLADAHAGATDLPVGTAPAHPAPEPGTLALFALGVALVGIAFLRRRPRPRDPKA
ncbi:MAG TPA: PEP-CTERM sorting domain-containing protein [Gammaproteobacteria bacterium]|jgi:hypothetical protein|nr:PEP-CTERM sorting domain-containing protein [Gammaproteobacteria bacterium]